MLVSLQCYQRWPLLLANAKRKSLTNLSSLASVTVIHHTAIAMALALLMNPTTLQSLLRLLRYLIPRWDKHAVTRMWIQDKMPNILTLTTILRWMKTAMRLKMSDDQFLGRVHHKDNHYQVLWTRLTLSTH